jgi:hypothetical protein
MTIEDQWAPLPRPGAGRRRVRALIELCRCLSAQLRGDPLPMPTDWAAVAATAESHRLTPPLWEAIRDLNWIDERIRTRLRAEFAANVVTNARMSEQLRAGLLALNDHGVEPVVLKGALVLLDEETSQPARVMTDLDLLVADEEIEDASSALRRIGYDVFRGPGGAARFEWTARRNDLAAPIDLHRALGVDAVARALPASAILGRALRRHVDGLTYRILDPSDQLAHAVVHSQCNDMAHRTGSVALRQLYNFAVLHHRVSSPDAWRTAVLRLSNPELRHVVGGHAALERYLFGLDLPLPHPSAAARLHLARCLASYAIPHLCDIETNLILAFEVHSMTERHPGASANSARLRHAIGLLRGGMGPVRSEVLRPWNR